MRPNCTDVLSLKQAPVDFNFDKGTGVELTIDFLDEVFCDSGLTNPNAWLEISRLSLTTNGRRDVTTHSTQTTLCAVVQEDAPPNLEDALKRSDEIWDRPPTFESMSTLGM